MFWKKLLEKIHKTHRNKPLYAHWVFINLFGYQESNIFAKKLYRLDDYLSPCGKKLLVVQGKITFKI